MRITKDQEKRIDALVPLTPVALEILLAVAEEAKHGYDIMVAIERRTEERLSPNPGTLYRAIDRLARHGLLEGRESPSPSGREVRKQFHLTTLGMRVLNAETKRLASQVNTARRLLKKARGM